jgi:Flp pilus assembly protein TadD
MSTFQDPEGSSAEPAEVGAAVGVEGPLGPLAERAATLAAQGLLPQALDAYTEAAAEQPDDVGVLLGLGQTLVHLGQYEAAERELRRALRLAPEQLDVRYQLGLTLFKRGNYAAAASELRRTTELEPSAAGFMVLGESLNQMGDPDGAIEALEQVARLQPENGKAFYAMGIAYDRKGQFERAAKMYRLSREVAARSPR